MTARPAARRLRWIVAATVATDDGGRGATVTVDIQDFELQVMADEDARGWCLGLIVVCTRKEDIYESTDVRAVTCRNRPRP